MQIRQTLFASLVAAACATAASGADLITVPTSTGLSLPVADTSTFDWGGFYAGIYGGIAAGDDVDLAAGLNAGVNAQFDFYLLGAEVAVEGLAGDIGETAYGQILGRAGLVASDDLLLYAAAGYGLELDDPNDDDVLLGGGVEAAVSASVTVRAQYLHSFPTQDGESADRVTLGAAFHF